MTIAPEAKKKKILTVEDNDALRLSLKIALEGAGFDVIAANDGVQALDAATSGDPDLILLDLFIPEIDGFKVLHLLKTDGRTGHIPVVVFSVLSHPDDKEKAMKLGAADYMVKSAMSIADVIDKVRTFF